MSPKMLGFSNISQNQTLEKKTVYKNNSKAGKEKEIVWKLFWQKEEIAELMGDLLWCNVLKGNPSYLYEMMIILLSSGGKDSTDTLLWQTHFSSPT